MKAVIAYIPVIHAGYERFLRNQSPDMVFLMGKSIRERFPRNERDIRALSAFRIKLGLLAMGFARAVSILYEHTLKETETYDTVVMPDEDISRWFQEKYLSGRPVEFASTFLRWDMPAALSQTPVDPDIVMSTDELHRKLMSAAEAEGSKSSDWWRQIGALALDEDYNILFADHNRHMPTERSPNIMGDPRSNFDAGQAPDVYTSLHGETCIVGQAARKSLEGKTILVDTFPCGNCLRLLAYCRIGTLIYRRGYSRLEGLEILKQYGIKVVHVPSEP